MSNYTGVIITTPLTINENELIGLKTNLLRGLEAGKEYTLQFKIINYSNENVLDNIYVGNQKLNDINISDFEQVGTVEGDIVRECHITYTSSESIETPILQIGRSLKSTDVPKSVAFTILEIQHELGTKTEATENDNDAKITKQMLESKFKQLADMISMCATNEELDKLGNSISKSLGQIDVKAGEIDLKVEIDNVINRINLSKEGINIDANKINLNGAVSINSKSVASYVRIVDACYTVVTEGTRSMYLGGWEDGNKKFVPVFYMGKNGFNSNSSDVDGTYFSMTHDGKVQTLGARNKFTGNWSSVVWDPENQQINFYPENKCYTNKPFHFGNGVHLSDVDNVVRAAMTSNGVYSDRITSYSGDTIWFAKNIRFENGQHMFTCNKIKGDTLLCDSDFKVWLNAYRALIPKDESVNTAYLGTASARWNRAYKVQADDISSDKRLKEDISYIDTTDNLKVASNNNITLDDMYDYIKNDLKLAKYKYKTSDEPTIGFIAQDIENTKVGDILINKDENGMLSYDIGTRIAVLEGALQKAINKIELLEGKISNLEAENEALKESQDIQDRTIIENDMRMMDIEWALEDLILANNPNTKINLTEVFNMKFGRSATYFNQLKQMIERENYDSKEEMERILNKYKSGRNPRITQEEYDQLFDLLYPPVYDIPTTIPEL